MIFNTLNAILRPNPLVDAGRFTCLIYIIASRIDTT